MGEMIHCRECGEKISSKAGSCPNCGAPQSGSSSGSDKSRITAAILAFFLGGIGVHKFYLEQSGQGILMLLFCWTFIPAIIAFVDFIRFLVMSDEEFGRKYA
jgi:TM2 domain-containing membrane protein YozV